MNKGVVSHLQETAKKLNCQLNTWSPEFDQTILYMIKTQTEKGNTRCPCDASGKTMCPCKDWVQNVLNGNAKPGDKCHCEVFEKLKNVADDYQFIESVDICRIPGRMVCTSGHNGKCSKCDVANKYLNPE